MLLINSKEGQLIYVGNKEMVVNRIAWVPAVKGSWIEYTLTDQHSKVLKLGDSVQLDHEVVLTLTKILRGQFAIAVLGFQAPRRVKIQGEWNKRN